MVVACDAFALVGFTVASIAAVLMPLPEVGPRHARVIRGLLLGALGIYVFTAFSNVLEHGGITAALDPYQDYIEILAFPLVAYALHEARVAGETARRERAERRLQEEHALLSTVMRVSPVGAMIVDAEGRVRFANEAAREMLRLREAGDGSLEFEEEPRCSPMRPGQDPALDLRWLGEGGSVSGALCAVGIGGTRRVLSVTSTPVPDVEGVGVPASGTLVIMQDVTDREVARQELMDAQARYAEALEYAVDARTAELLKANEELQAANDAKRQLLANVSHELRTPLNAVIGFADVLANGLAGPLAEEQAKQVAMIREAGRQLLELVEALLEAQWLESSEAIVEARPVDVADLVRSAVQILDPLARTKGLALRAETPETLEAVTDARLIGQVLRNLISNAVKFTHEGGVTVRLLDAGDRFRIAVADTGIGIPKEALPRIFDAFVQVPGSRGEKPEGTGLGLAICKQIAEALGGSIAVESEPGSGSTFTVELPKEPVSG